MNRTDRYSAEPKRLLFTPDEAGQDHDHVEVGLGIKITRSPLGFDHEEEEHQQDAPECSEMRRKPGSLTAEALEPKWLEP